MLVHFVQNVWIARVLPLRLWAYIPFLDRAAAFDGFGNGRVVSRCVIEDGVAFACRLTGIRRLLCTRRFPLLSARCATTFSTPRVLRAVHLQSFRCAGLVRGEVGSHILL